MSSTFVAYVTQESFFDFNICYMEISAIKSKLSLQSVLDHYNLKPDRNNRLTCPWHNDKTPSLQIYPKTNTWTCFSSNCNAGSGDQIDFIMKYEKITKHEALVKATQLAGGDTNDLPRAAILTKYYQSTLQSITKSSRGLEYCKSRGLDHDQLGIGFCAYDVGKSWNKNLKASAEKIGLYKIRNCIIFPTRDAQGKVVSIYGRSVSKNPKVRHFYLSGGFRGLYPGYPKTETKKLILTESIIDAGTIKQYTDHEILALYGTNGFTKEHTDTVNRLTELEEIIIFFDGDEAGKSAKEKYYTQLKELRPDIKISYVETPEGEDPNSLVISHKPEILNYLIKDRKPFAQEKPSNENKTLQNPGRLYTDNSELLLYRTNSLNVTILGGIKITGLDRLRVTLKIEKQGCLPIRHNLDLYHSKQVEMLIEKMNEGLEIGASACARMVNHLTGCLESHREIRLEALKPKKIDQKLLSESERKEAIKYLKAPKLLRNTLNDISHSGIVGESKNALIAYLAYTSRKREKPLHIMCLGASGTGKTYLQEIVSSLIPEEDKIEITSLSDNAFYYFGREELKHKLILIEDLDGAENVLYPLRELQSKRRISKTVTIKDNKGNLKTITLRVEGPVCVSGCTTREKIYEDNANRCILLYIDTSKEQDRRIMKYQKEVSSGQVDHQAEWKIKEQFKNVQRVLQPIRVINPYASLIDLPQEVFKPRRTLMLLLSFIETITFYHQYQREVQTHAGIGKQYIESSKDDIKYAFHLMKEVLFNKSDELSNASRSFLERLKKQVKSGEAFSAGKIRKQMRIAPSTLKRYLIDLVRHGYVKVKGGSKHRGYEYAVCDYKEYEELRNKIDDKLAEILTEIDKKSGSVAHQWPTKTSEPLNVFEIN